MIVAVRLSSAMRYYLGLTSDGMICALIQTDLESSGADVRLRNLEVRQAIRCRVRDSDGREAFINGCLIVCRSDQATLQDLFLRLYDNATEELGDVPSARSVAEWLRRLVTLLSRLEQDARRTLQGLWAELLVIRELGDSMMMLRRWHADPQDRFDFLGDGFALEVKSCQDFDRVHTFSLEQLRPPSGLVAWVASVVVRRDLGGCSIMELAGLIESDLGEPAAKSLFREAVLATGGSALEDDDNHRFDLVTARGSLRLLDTQAIPSFHEPVPLGVLSVTLTVRCATLDEIGTRADALGRLSDTAYTQGLGA